ncbi:MAG: sortase [Erysipelotrichaceae bacterium]|nr:sortase [Erysipelotrichaceae bacterium]
MFKKGTLLQAAGTAGISAFLLIVPSSLVRQAASLDRSQKETEKIVQVLAAQTNVQKEQDPDFQDIQSTYEGILIVPREGLMVPLLKEWTESSFCPGVWKGSVNTKNLIAAGHNDPSQFRILHHLSVNDEVQILDMNQICHTYRVIGEETLQPDEAGRLLDQNSQSWDLTLFTCTFDNLARRVIRLQEVI